MKFDSTLHLSKKSIDIIKFESSDSSLSVDVRPVSYGSQVIFTGRNPAAKPRFTVDFGKPIKETVGIDSHQVVLIFSDDTSVTLQKPWAYDATGKELPTHYEFTGSKLRQLVTTSAATEYPIIADPAWTYATSIAVSIQPLSKIRDKMKRCFNCYFPVEGAPASWPRSNQILPLRISIAGFGLAKMTCTFDSEKTLYDSANEGYWGFKFRATAEHADGLGSWIDFQFARGGKSNVVYLVVNAYIVKSNPANVPRATYEMSAIRTWAEFANNIRTKG